MKIPIRLVRLSNHSIFHQLRVEEALLRTCKHNYCFVTDGARSPAVVMGLGDARKPHSLVDVKSAHSLKIPLIRRFSGGGTVVVDQNTTFVTLIFNKGALGIKDSFPCDIMKWSAEFFTPIFTKLDNPKTSSQFCLQQQDYAFGQKKIGGNAQCIIKDRFLHHTSFLWDFDEDRMNILKFPGRTPDYRSGRS
eukprot:844072_1